MLATLKVHVIIKAWPGILAEQGEIKNIDSNWKLFSYTTQVQHIKPDFSKYILVIYVLCCTTKKITKINTLM